MLDHTSPRDLFRILFAFLCFCRQMPGTKSENNVVLSPPTVVVLHGSAVSVNCSTNVTHKGMAWEVSEGQVDLTENVQHLTWNVPKLTHWEIRPFCYISLGGSPDVQIKEILNITVYKPPDQVSISTVGHTGPMLEGKSYTLQCDIQNFAPVRLLTVSWYKGQVKLENFPTSFKEETTPFPVSKSLTLQISPNRDDDGVQYSCEAELHLGPEGPQPPPIVKSELLNITVNYKPSGISELHSSQVYSGDNVTLKCASNAKPPPQYKWTYHQSSNVHITEQDGISLLHINRPSGDNIGTYTCTAYNELGETKQDVRVDVQGVKATCPVWISKESAVLEFGNSVSISCNSNESSALLSWNFQTLNLSSKVFNETTLVINSAFADLLDWNGIVSCDGTFVGLDACRKDVNIVIYKPPDQVSVSILNHTGPLIVGKTYTLNCDVQNVAPVHLLTVNWYKGPHLMTSESFNHSNIPLDISVTLMVSPSRNDSFTQYRCEAVLELPPVLHINKSDSLNISVHYKPIITYVTSQRVPLFPGYSTNLTCEASGYPEPTVAWIFNNTRVESRNLTVKDNEGNYTCIANNSVGNDTRVVTVVMTDVKCDLVLRPSKVLVAYGASASVDCFTKAPRIHSGMGWEASQGAVNRIDVQVLTWKVESLLHWDIQPVCFLNTMHGKCEEKLPVTVYKLPDRVSISTVAHTGPMIEGKQYDLQCGVDNIAPVHLLTVNWYKGQHLVAKTSFSDSTKIPVNQSTRYHVTLNRADDGARYRCEAVLNLSGTRAQASSVTSQVLGINVHYSPQFTRVEENINETTQDITLNCTVMANPPPRYTWTSASLGKEFNKGSPILSLAQSSLGSGNYTCTAWNEIGSISKLFVVHTKPKGGDRTTFWAIVGPFVGLAAVVIAGYVLIKSRTIKK